MATTTIKALIFDFDGTLLDTETPEYHAWQAIYRDHGHELALLDWLQGVGTWYAFDPYDDLAQKLGQPVDRDHVRARLRELIDPVLAEAVLREGVEHLLRDAKQRGLKLAVASSSSHKWVDSHLERYDLLTFFDAIKCRDDVQRSKPDPELYLAALDALDVDAEETLAFEDSLNGLRAARAAGIFTVAVVNAITQHMQLDEADLLVRSFEAVKLDELFAHLQPRTP